jgi:hypothetical protein
MNKFLEYMPPIEAWLPGIVMFALVVGISLLALRRGWRSPAAAGFWLSTGVMGIAIVMWTLVTRGSGNADRPDRSFLQEFIPLLVGVVSFTGATAATNHSLRRRRVALIIAGTALAAIVAYPLAFLAMMYAACMTGLGCI